jgi:hypothetical protein
MMPTKDPMAGALPAQKDPRSPALTGQPESVTGQGGMGAALTGNIPKTQSMAPASPPVGNAEVGGAPLSSNGANEQQGGAGANPMAELDLVQDRGTPEEYWKKNIKNLGSKDSLRLLGDAAMGSSSRTGKLAQEDPEEVRRMGTRMNEAMGLGDPEQQDAIVESMIFKPMQDSIQYEVQKGVIDEDEGVMRMAMAMANVQGAADEDELASILGEARARIKGIIGPEGEQFVDFVQGAKEFNDELESGNKLKDYNSMRRPRPQRREQ